MSEKLDEKDLIIDSLCLQVAGKAAEVARLSASLRIRDALIKEQQSTIEAMAIALQGEHNGSVRAEGPEVGGAGEPDQGSGSAGQRDGAGHHSGGSSG